VSALGVEEQRVLVLSDFVEQTPALKALGDRYRVEVRVAVWHSDDTLLVPAGALFREGSEWKTFLFDAGKARAVIVKAGRTDGRLTQVLEGLKPGDEVLMHPPDNGDRWQRGGETGRGEMKKAASCEAALKNELKFETTLDLPLAAIVAGEPFGRRRR
jgi:multidrug efflux pump subunit AcrA (membrane-fusion protein)